VTWSQRRAPDTRHAAVFSTAYNRCSRYAITVPIPNTARCFVFSLPRRRLCTHIGLSVVRSVCVQPNAKSYPSIYAEFFIKARYLLFASIRLFTFCLFLCVILLSCLLTFVFIVLIYTSINSQHSADIQNMIFSIRVQKNLFFFKNPTWWVYWVFRGFFHFNVQCWMLFTSNECVSENN